MPRLPAAVLLAAVLLAPVLPAALLLAPGPAHADDSPHQADTDTWELVYDLRLGDEAVGSRTVTVRWLGEDRRIIESYTELSAPLPAGGTWTMTQRASATTDTASASFTSSVDEAGTVREVQGRQRRDGRWTVAVVGGGDVRQDTVPAGRIDLSSLELLDPVRHRELTGRSRATVLAAETGTLLSGTVTDLGETRRTIDGQVVPVHAWTWAPESGPVTLSWSLDGVLVAYESQWMGRTLSAELRDPPPRRRLGEVDPVGDVIERGIVEEEL